MVCEDNRGVCDSWLLQFSHLSFLLFFAFLFARIAKWHTPCTMWGRIVEISSHASNNTVQTLDKIYYWTCMICLDIKSLIKPPPKLKRASFHLTSMGEDLSKLIQRIGCLVRTDLKSVWTLRLRLESEVLPGFPRISFSFVESDQVEWIESSVRNAASLFVKRIPTMCLVRIPLSNYWITSVSFMWRVAAFRRHLYGIGNINGVD